MEALKSLMHRHTSDRISPQEIAQKLAEKHGVEPMVSTALLLCFCEQHFSFACLLYVS